MIKNDVVLDVGIQIPAALSEEKYVGARTLPFTIAILNYVIMPPLSV